MDGAIDNLKGLLAMYQEERFFFVGVCSTVLSITAFLVFALPWTWVAWKNPESLRKYRVQGRDIPVKKWLRPSLRRFAFNNLVSSFVFLALWPLGREAGVGIDFDQVPAWYVVGGQVLLFILLDDFFYYWMHRALHTSWLYKHVHSIHHRITTPYALTGNYMHVVEFLLTTMLVLAGPMLLGVHVVTLWVWIVFRQLEAADGHSGYDVPWNPALLFPFYKGPAYHDFHHRRFFGNYAGFFAYLDKLFGGTCSPGYEDYRRDSGAPQPVPVPVSNPAPGSEG